MAKIPTSVEVEAELASIKATITRLQERQTLLVKFLDLAKQIGTNQGEHNVQPQSASNLAKRNGHHSAGVGLAERILAQVGPLSIQRLLEEMLKNGWADASEDNLRLWHRLRKTLISHPETFDKQGRGLWDVKPEKQLGERKKYVPQ